MLNSKVKLRYQQLVSRWQRDRGQCRQIEDWFGQCVVRYEFLGIIVRTVLVELSVSSAILFTCVNKLDYENRKHLEREQISACTRKVATKKGLVLRQNQ